MLTKGVRVRIPSEAYDDDEIGGYNIMHVFEEYIGNIGNPGLKQRT